MPAFHLPIYLLSDFAITGGRCGRNAVANTSTSSCFGFHGNHSHCFEEEYRALGTDRELRSDADSFFHVHMIDFTFYAFMVCYDPRMPQCFPAGLHSFQIELICNSWPLNW